MARSVAWYGESGSFKSTQVIYLAKYIYEKTGKKTRVVLTDSSAGDMFKPMEQAGLMDVWRISSLKDPLLIARLLAKGYWPQVIAGTNTIKMMEPTVKTWEEIGCIVFDSITTFCDLIMADLINKGQKIAEDVVNSFSESVAGTSGTETIKFGAAARAHYNFIQNQVYNLINSASSLPIELLGLTLLEAKAEEQDRSTIYGPSIIGKAATAKFPAWVGDLIHFDSTMVPVVNKVIGKDAAGKAVEISETIFETQVRAYFMRHPDPKTGVNHPAKPRVPPEKFKELLQRFPGGYFIPTTENGIDLFLRAEDELLAASAGGMKAWREEMDAKRRGTGTIAVPASAAPAKV